MAFFADDATWAFLGTTASLGIAVVLAAAALVAGGRYLKAREARAGAAHRARLIADASVEGLVILEDNRIVEANDSFLRLVGRSMVEVRGEAFVGNLLTADFGSDLPGSMLWEAQIAGRDGRAIPVEVLARDLPGRSERYSVFAIRDLSDRRDAELRVRFLAEHDPLTGLPNRASFQREIERRTEDLAGGGARFGLFYIDLDGFKEANDRYGHLAGDAVLVEVGHRLRRLLGDTAFVARLGGDEFVALLAHIATPHVAGALGEDLIATLSEPYSYAGQRITIGCSIGIALAPGDGERPDVLLARADMALYRAKDEGRGRHCFFAPSMDEEIRARRRLAFDLGEAIDAGGLEIHYEPQADAATGTVTGFEARARWNHPKLGPISPRVFVPIAEESGLMPALGDHVLRSVAREAARWEKPLQVAVNLSPLQLDQPTLPATVHQVLIETGLAPSRLELEVSEAALHRNPQRALDVLRRLKALGVGIIVDDFGDGLSPFATLQSFPFDKLKLHRSFADRMVEHPAGLAVVRAVLGLGRGLDIAVLADGVETEEQRRLLREEACREVQGLLVGAARPIDAYADLVGPSAARHKSA